ncbi:MAG: Ig-like domain-containing protein [Gemmatimonadota bacterium]
MRSRAATLPLVAAVAFACAQPGSPPGGEPDRAPPRVIEVRPAAFDTLRDLDAPVVIRFNERISERLDGVPEWNDAVLVSPATSPVDVDAGSRSIEIALVRDWEPDRVYRIVVRPVFRDLFNNARVEPIELVFSTGAPIFEAALVGFVTDRLTGRTVEGAWIEAVRRIDATPHVALTDSAGFFALRYLPAGAYDVRAWQDADRDRVAEFFEPQDSVEVAFGVEDTTVVELALLPPDTTPAVLARASVIDSTKVRLLFDDHFAVGPVDGQAWLHTLPDSALVGEGWLLHGSRLDSILAAEEAARDSVEAARADSVAAVRGDTARADTGRAEPPPDAPRTDTTEAERRPARRAQAGAADDALPSQELIFRVPGVLIPDTSYYVRVDGVTNIQGVPGGGGTAAFTTPPPPPPDTVPADTIPPDTIPPDTIPPARARGGE